MANSLLTGISGLRGHQKMLEVIGNNLANVNTTAFKSARVLFSDLMYEAARGASSSTKDILGSVNPIQIGTGSKVTSIDLNFQQGNLEDTGQDLDAAIDGPGFFVASNGRNQVYTRSGSFSLDENGYLEDASTGYLIQRFGTIGETEEAGRPAFQSSGDPRIQIPIGTSIPGSVTTEVEFSGQLGSSSTGPINHVLQGANLTVGGAAPTVATLLNDLDTNIVSYATGDRILFGGHYPNGQDITSAFDVDATTSVGDLINHIQSIYGTTANVSLVGSAIQIEDAIAGVSSVSLRLEDDPTNTGFSNAEFTTNFASSVRGQDATSIDGNVPIFDEGGSEHPLNYRIEKQADNSWTINFSMDPGSGTLIDSTVHGIRFGADGSLDQVGTTGDGDKNISIIFADSSLAHTIDLNLGTIGDVDGLSQLGSSPEISFATDGSTPGELTAVQLDADGIISGVATNGRKIPLGQLAIAAFRNPDGLTQVGGNYYEQSLASGAVEMGTALSGDRGAIRSGQLEGSNVDLALEFTRLLVAQRGFSANARTITVTDEILEELTNIIR